MYKHNSISTHYNNNLLGGRKIMRYQFLYIYIVTIVMSFTLINQVNAKEDSPAPSFIDSFEDDITGDGLREYFKLQGRFLSVESSYYQNIWLEVTSPFSKEWTISLKGGYDPTLSLYDLNHDNVFDILYQVAVDEEKSKFFTQAYTLKNGNVDQIKLPTNNQIKGKYIDDFRIALSLHINEDPIYIPVTNRELYIENGLYSRNGNILKEENVVIDSIKDYIPTLISESKGYGLKSIREIRSAYADELLGAIETLWYFDKNKWIILNNNWQPL